MHKKILRRLSPDNFKTGKLNMNYELRYIGNQLLVDAESVKTVGGRPPEDPDAQDFLTTGNAFYHSARIGYNLNKDSDVYVSVDNIFDRKPPFGLSGAGTGSAIFDSIGRYITIGLSAKF